jgi:hypothetical protein
MPNEPLADVISAAELQAAELRRQINELEHITAELKRLLASSPGFRFADAQTRTSELKTSISEAEGLRAKLEQLIDALKVELDRAEKQAPIYAALAQLFQAGARLGLLDDACPLCGTTISDAHLRDHIDNGNKKLDEIGKKTSELLNQRNGLQQELDGLTLQLARMHGDLAARTEAISIWQANRKSIEERAERLALKFDVDGGNAEQFVLAEIGRRRESIDTLEKVTNILRSREFARQIEALEADVGRLKASRLEQDQALSILRSALSKGAQADADLRREINRLIDERLALLSPLTKEFYSRLRPHIAWRDLNYYVRGDLRKFLSLRVGDNLNPAFMFSSGQRRAAGMAFLLSLYLARSWCRLQTIILDDPVQHIDDYRALHIAELLAAFCRSGHQVICTVEDPALADLLCRRLRGGEGVTGVRIDMEYVPEDGIKVARIRNPVPPPRQVLLSA